MRTIHELLTLLRDNAEVETSWFGLKQRISIGLCREVMRLRENDLISVEEYWLIYDHIRINRPRNTHHAELYSINYSWKPTLWNPRLKWLNEQIKLTKV